MPLDNITRIMERVSDYVGYHAKYPNVLIIGWELWREMDFNVNSTTLLSELERVKSFIRPTGYKMFDIVAKTEDIEGFVMMRVTLR